MICSERLLNGGNSGLDSSTKKLKVNLSGRMAQSLNTLSGTRTSRTIGEVEKTALLSKAMAGGMISVATKEGNTLVSMRLLRPLTPVVT